MAPSHSVTSLLTYPIADNSFCLDSPVSAKFDTVFRFQDSHTAVFITSLSLLFSQPPIPWSLHIKALLTHSYPEILLV